MSGRWKIAAAVLVGLVASMAVGCVPKSQYNEAVTASQRANEEMGKAQSALQESRAENQKLAGELAMRDASLAANDRIINNLKQASESLAEKLARLKELYDKAAGRDVPPPAALTVVLPPKVDTALRGLADKNADLMEYLPNYGMIKLKADLTFDKGSAEVRPEAAEALAKLGEIVNRKEAGMFHVYVAGHTDDIPLVKPETIKAHGSNWGLSLHRAGGVVKILAAAGVQQRRMGAIGFSKYHPVAPNAPSHKGNPLNRRVEIWIVPPDRLLTASSVVQPEK